MAEYYGNVVVVEKRWIRLDAKFGRKPTKEAVLAALQNGDYNDITDEGTMEYMEVLEVKDLEKQ